MFSFLGYVVSRYWPVVIGLWVVLVGLVWVWAPDWSEVARSGEVAFLPEDSPSRRGEELFKQAFPLDYSGSNVVLVLWRAEGTLREEDKELISKEIAPAIGAMVEGDEHSPITSIHTFAEEGIGKLLISQDKQATLVLIELTTVFQEKRNNPVVSAIEGLVSKLQAEGRVPAGLNIGVTGSATAGRDLNMAEMASVHTIETWTIVVVVALLLLLYRAPFLAAIPLVTVFVSVTLATALVALVSQLGWFSPSPDLRVFVTVLAYGAGVDYCVFLIARYREELERGHTPREATAAAITNVGVAISASAATVIGGIGMLAFARFGKIHEAGLVIPFALTVTLLGTLTFTPALLRLTARCAFWPRCIKARPKNARPGDLLHRLVDEGVAPHFWQRLGPTLLRHPGAIWLGSVAAMAPFVVIALLHYDETNFNPLGELPDSTPSAAASQVLENHFPPGALGPVTVLLRHDSVDFAQEPGVALIKQVSDNLVRNAEALDLADVRSIAEPVGTSPAAQQILARYRMDKKELEKTLVDRAQGHYVSQAEGTAGHVTRLDLTLATDPLSQRGIAALELIDLELPNLLPQGLHGSRIELVGSTAALRDLSDVKRADQQLIQVLVSAVVFVLLVILLRRFIVSAYLILSVLFSYLATLGLTYLVFWLLYGDGFLGLDWKVPIFLFTILVAVGEDYNIFLLTRIKEERHHHGPLAAIPIALAQTGQVISGCGFIMAGTFASLLSGSLRALLELGFALSVGILIDTLVVRPILVPAFLVLLQRFIPGRLGRYMALGAREREAVTIG